jgi:hypothetical protein
MTQCRLRFDVLENLLASGIQSLSFRRLADFDVSASFSGPAAIGQVLPNCGQFQLCQLLALGRPTLFSQSRRVCAYVV